MNVAELLSLPRLAGDLERVEATLRASVTAADPFLAEVGGHLSNAGGKRFRPALAIAAAAAGGAEVTDDVIRGGVSVELVHLGSLYHDDVMDEAEVRRGVPSANAKWGNLVAILAGDFLLAKASEIAASLGTEVAGLLASTIGRLCEGQVGELQTAYQVSRSEEAYLRSITGKTASLMAAACRIGAITAGLPRPQIDALTTFGEAFGIAFQIRDDILDVCASDEELGKPAGNDLVEGVYTLPVLRTLELPGAGPQLRALLGGPLTAEQRDEARQIVRGAEGVESALVTARRYADEAVAALEPFGDEPVAQGLARLTTGMLDDLSG